MVLEKILKQLLQFKNKNKIYPKCIYISKKNYRRLKREMSIIEEMTENIKELYFIEFKIKEE